MGVFREVEVMFRGIVYNKFTSSVVRAALTAKVKAVQDKIEERHRRVEKIIADNEITPEAMNELILQYMQDQQRGNRNKMSYSTAAVPMRNVAGASTEKVVPAGVVANLATEKELISNETAEVRRMALILRNLKDTQPHVDDEGRLVERPTVHTLDDTDIEYLGL
jgi:hypothetical protein